MLFSNKNKTVMTNLYQFE